MTENEEKARITINNCMINGYSIQDLYYGDIILTDKECMNIAKNYPYNWRDIKSYFLKMNNQNKGTIMDENVKVCIDENEMRQIMFYLTSALKPSVIFDNDFEKMKTESIDAKDQYVILAIDVLKKQPWADNIFKNKKEDN